MFVCTLDLSLCRALKRYSEIESDQNFTLLDCSILCLAKSFATRNKQFYMSNTQIGKYLMATDRTVQTSINRLCDAGFLVKEEYYVSKTKRRVLIYQDDAVQDLISRMRIEDEVWE